MTLDTHWDATRWREVRRNALEQDPHYAASTPRDKGHPHNVLVEHNQQPWKLTSSGHLNVDKPSPTPLAYAGLRHAADASSYHAWSTGRNYTPALAASYERPLTSPHEDLTTPRRSSDHTRQATATDRVADAPLSLHIPNSNDLPNVPPALAAPSPGNFPPHQDDLYKRSSSISLPSFASLHTNIDRKNERNDDFAPISACRACASLEPVIQEVAIAVTELGKLVQTRCGKPITRTPNCPQESSLHVAQWALDRLVCAKSDLRDAYLQTSLTHGNPQQPYYSHVSPHNRSPPSTLKRPPDTTDSEEGMMPFKRQRSGSISDPCLRSSSLNGTQDAQKTGIDTAQRESLSHSLPTSAHPRQQSPNFQSQSCGPLPSPSSLAYPATAASSVIGATAPSASSPTTSYHPGSSIHAASTTSAASQHIADLQHQVTLKSLSLQTLQSEYSSLLQKFQRERTKIQAIEKKTSVADKEVNELIGKNEDLTEQVKTLENQLEELERKRESEREAASREKEQYGRMLDMGGRLNAKNAEDRRELLEEKARLERRVLAYEQENEVRFQQIKSNFNERLKPLRRDSPVSEADADPYTKPTLSEWHDLAASRQQRSSSTYLHQENAILRSKVEVMRSALEETKRQTAILGQKERDIQTLREKAQSAIEQALQDDNALLSPMQPETVASRELNRASELPIVMPTDKLRALSKAQRGVENQGFIATLPSPSQMAKMGRAYSPGPAELGFEVTPSTSSPEEIMKALGPVPVSLPVWQPPNIVASNPASTNKRTSSGPSTPYPGSDLDQWPSYPVMSQQELHSSPSRRKSPESANSSSSSPGRLGHKAEIPHHTNQWQGATFASSPTRSSDVQRAQQQPAFAPMLPPPKPAAASTSAASWRPS